MIQKIKNILVRSHMHEIVECLVAALDARDYYTSGHSSRVGDMSFELGKTLGMKGEVLDSLHMAAHLHDIGKLGIPESILNKKEKLLNEEYLQIQKHPEISYNILNKSKGLHHLAETVLCHHERWDGNGYPHGLKDISIPIGSRIIAVADSLDAMTSKRSYREAMSWEQALEELWRNQGKQFDPDIVEAAGQLWKIWEQRYTIAV